MTLRLRWLAILSVLSTGIGMLLILAVSAWTTQPHPGGLGNLGLSFPLLIAVVICPLPAVAAASVALVAAARARHPDAVVAFLVLAAVSVGIVFVLNAGPNIGWTDWLLQRISRSPGDLLRSPRPILELYALDLLIPVAVFAYTAAGTRKRPAVMTTCVLVVVAASVGLLLLGAG
jgi:hypothetical protein